MDKEDVNSFLNGTRIGAGMIACTMILGGVFFVILDTFGFMWGMVAWGVFVGCYSLFAGKIVAWYRR